MKKIIVIGSSNIDMVVRTSHLPAPGETILGGEFFMNQGGKGANQAVAVKRLGGNLIFVAKLGNDILGQQSVDYFKKEGIDTKYEAITGNLKNIYYDLQELSRDISNEKEDIYFDEQERNEVEERLDLIYSLKRKYICPITNIFVQL